MLELGGNIYFIYKIGLVVGLTPPEITSQMAGQTAEEYVAMMRNGGRVP